MTVLALFRRARLPLLAAALAAALLPGRAAAHTKLQSSQPADGDTVSATLAEVRIRFSAAVEAGLTSLVLIRGTDTVAAGAVPVEGSGGREFVLALRGPLAPGEYRARWRTAGHDGHVLNGGFGFFVSAPPAAAVPPPAPMSTAVTGDSADPAPTISARPAGEDVVDAGAAASEADRPLAVLARWAWFASLLGMIGVVAFRFGVLWRIQRGERFAAVAARADGGLGAMALGAASLSVLSLFARLFLQASALGGAEGWAGANLDTLLTGTVWGLAWCLQAIATLAFVLGMLISRAPYGRAAGWMGAAGSVLLLAAVPALSGHAASADGPTAIAILADTLHVLGAGVWMGGLLMLVGVGIPSALAEGPSRGAAVAEMVRAFSPTALISASVVALTGLISGKFHLNATRDLWTTGYGRMLLIKVGLVLCVAALGWHNWKRVSPTLGSDEATRRLQRASRLELAMAVVVLLVTAILVALPTP